MHSFTVLSVVVVSFLLFSFSWSLPVGIKYLYHDSSCANQPYEIEILYTNVCIYTRDHLNSTAITPVLYADAFVNGTVLIHEYTSTTCTGSFNTVIQQLPTTTCTLHQDILSNETHYSKYQVFATNPDLASLTNNRPYYLLK